MHKTNPSHSMYEKHIKVRVRIGREKSRFKYNVEF